MILSFRKPRGGCPESITTNGPCRSTSCSIGHAAHIASPAAGSIKAYRYTLSPLVGFHCRHLPTCSDYADQAIERYGLWAGGWMTFARLLRCHPWGTHGLDFVCDELPGKARWYLPWRYARWRGANAMPRDAA